MSARNVTTIPATITRFTHAPLAARKKRRTAGYARVSTDSDEQFTSYAAQVDYYEKYIKSRDDWEFVSVYTDEGISGTSTAHREGFKAMIADALAGKIDLIVTNIKPPHLIQYQTRGKTSEVFAIRAFEVFCCPVATPFYR